MSGCSKHKASAEKSAAASPNDPSEVTVDPALAAQLKIGRAAMFAMSPTRLKWPRALRQMPVESLVWARRLRGALSSYLCWKANTRVMARSWQPCTAPTCQITQFAFIKAFSQQALAEQATNRAEQLGKADVIGTAELERRRAELLQASTEASAFRTQLRGLGMTMRRFASLNRHVS